MTGNRTAPNHIDIGVDAVRDLQVELESLRRENARLRRLLKLTDPEAAPARGTQMAWFDKAPGSIDASSSSQAKVQFYAASDLRK